VFVDVVERGRPPTAGFEDGRCALILADAAWEALRSGRSVPIRYG
jgi:myo-inositol 2-dehydrogenase/D-chiro-inositol 1-dehydrogenase